MTWNLGTIIVAVVFLLGYLGIVFEYTVKIHKSAVALLMAVLTWLVYIVTHHAHVEEGVKVLGEFVGKVAQIIFFLLGGMTLVELIDCHRGFKIITDKIKTHSQRKLLWITAIVSFCLSAVLDNLTTTILMVSLLRKLVPHHVERILLACVIVIAANAGGAWTPIGDVTTTMLWIENRISTMGVIKAVIVPSIVSILIPMFWYTWRVRGRFSAPAYPAASKLEPGANVVLVIGLSALIFVPIFKALTGMPPFMGIILSLAVMWILTDVMHHKYEERDHLRVPHILTRVDTSGVLFFLGILLAVNALEAVGLLGGLAEWLNNKVVNHNYIALILGLFSAFIDNVPLVAATTAMYPLQQYPMDAPFWHLMAYTAGTGGSLLVVGSSAGVAMMGLEKVDFFSYIKHATLPTLVGYFAGFAVYLALH